MQFTLFRRFLAATGLSNFSDGIALVSWGWIATALTRDPLLIALVPVALKTPWFVFSLPAGILVDRHDRRRIILVADALRAVAYTAAGLAVWWALPFDNPPLRGTDHPATFALVALCAISVGLAEVLRDNAAQTMLPAVVPEDALERANGRLWSVEYVMNNFIGTAAAGVLLGVSLALPFGVNAAALALSVALIARMKGDFRADVEATAERRHWYAELHEGFAFLMSNEILRNLALLTGLFNFAFEAMLITLVLIVQERLQLGPLALSVIMAAGGAGGVLAGMANERMLRLLGRARSMQVWLAVSLVFPAAVLVAGGGYCGLAVIAAAFFVTEFGSVIWNTVSVSYRQRTIPRRLLGRVNSAYRLFAIGMAPLGMLTAGLLIRGASNLAPRETALLAPYLLALALLAAGCIGYWRFLARAFAVEPPKSPR